MKTETTTDSPTVGSSTLFGAVEWIISQDGTVKEFNSHIVMGEVCGIHYRYFITEGWIGLKTDDCPKGKARQYTSRDSFIAAVQYFANALDQESSGDSR